jgi:hypothetical protein
MFWNTVWHPKGIASATRQHKWKWLPQYLWSLKEMMGSPYTFPRRLFWRRWQPKLTKLSQYFFCDLVRELSGTPHILTSTYVHKEKMTIAGLSNQHSDQHMQGTRGVTNWQTNSSAKYNMDHNQMMRAPALYTQYVPDDPVQKTVTFFEIMSQVVGTNV